MDDTSSLPTTNIINLSYDRSMFFLVFFFFFKKKQIIKGKDLQRNGTNTTKDQTQVRREKEKERKGTRKAESKVT
jgi:hypothetical protein